MIAPLEQPNEQIIERIKQITGFRSCKLNYGKWKETGFDSMYQFVKQIPSMRVCLSHNKNSQLLKLVENIEFANTKIIGFKDNNLNSIECINRVYFPNLEQLYLNYNNIMRMKELRKVNLPQLQKFSLNSNPLTDVQAFFEWNVKNLQWLCVQWTDSPNIGGNLHWLLKSDVIGLKKLKMKSKDRITNGFSDDSFVKKWKNIILVKYQQ